MKEMNIGRGYVYSLHYHIVWCVKKRRNILNSTIKDDCKEIIYNIADEYNIKVLNTDINSDHIHMVIECRPQHYIPDIIKIFKGISAKSLFDKHPEIRDLLWDKHLWDSNYFVATESEDIMMLVKDYVNHQKKDSPTLASFKENYII